MSNLTDDAVRAIIAEEYAKSYQDWICEEHQFPLEVITKGKAALNKYVKENIISS